LFCYSRCLSFLESIQFFFPERTPAAQRTAFLDILHPVSKGYPKGLNSLEIFPNSSGPWGTCMISVHFLQLDQWKLYQVTWQGTHKRHAKFIIYKNAFYVSVTISRTSILLSSRGNVTKCITKRRYISRFEVFAVITT
jgi:hypothetical protein